MKFLVLSALVAVSTASLVTFPNGAVVPADTFEVQAARAAHFAAGGAIHPVHAYAAYPLAYGYPHALVGYHNGAIVPVDEPAVIAAKAAHAAAGGAVHPVGYAGAFYAGYPYGLVAHPSSGAVVPVEPVDVIAARAAHAEAYAAALSA